MTYLKPVKERKELDFRLPIYEETLEDFVGELDRFKAELLRHKKEGWEGIEQDYDFRCGLKPYLYKYNMVLDGEYDRKITLALQNKPSWDDAPEGAESLGIAIWECDYQYEWVWFYHKEPNPGNTIFVEVRPDLK
jgi:hypothetical protein